MKFSFITLIVILLAMLSYPVLADPNNTQNELVPNVDYVPGEVIVKYKDTQQTAKKDVTGINTYSKMTTEILNKKHGIQEVKNLGKGTTVMKFDKDRNAVEVAKEYEKDPNVEYAEPNYLFHVALSPNDPSFSSQYHHNNINSTIAWNTTQGNRSIIIAIIDTGVEWDNSDLEANIWNNTDESCTGANIDNDGNGFKRDCRGWDFVDTTGCHSSEDCATEDNDPMDFNGHGTHVSGLAAGVGNNSDKITGICWNCQIMALRAGYSLPNGNGVLETADIVQAVNYAVDNGANIISMSFSTTSDVSSIREVIESAYSQGVVLVAAAGNSNNAVKNYPAAYDQVIAVGSTDSSNGRSSFSNYGTYVDIAAPGTSILSTYPTNTTTTLSGTSMSTPIISGVIGLMLSRNNFTQEEVRTIIRSSAINVSSGVLIGTGIINASKSVIVNQTLITNILSQLDDKNVSGSLQINGTANGTNFVNFSLYIGSNLYSSSWVLINSSNSSVNNGSLFTWDTTGVADNNYTVKLESNDSLNQSFFDFSFIIVDNVPRINITDPANNTLINSSTYIINSSISEVPSSCSLELDGTNYTMNISGQTCYRNISLTTGNHTFIIWATDLSSKTNSSANFTIIAEATAPSVAIQFPTNNTTYTTNNLSFNYTAVDTNLDSCRYELDGDSTLTSNCANATLSNLTEGLHNITIFANDTLNNTNSSSISFRVDLTAPNITIEYPTEDSNFTSINITINYTVVDANIDKCYYVLNSDDASIISGCSNTTIIASSRNNSLQIFVNDTAGNTRNTSVVNFTTDSAPNITFNFTNNTIFSNSTPNIEFTCIDNLNSTGLSVSIYLNGTASGNNSSVINSTLTNITVNSSKSDGFYFLNATCTDGANLTANSIQLTIGIDTTPPNISMNLFPTKLLAGENISVLANITDHLNISNLSAIWVNITSLNETLNTTITNVTYMSINTTYNTTNLSTGNYTATVFARDLLNHVKNVSMNFTVTESRKLNLSVFDYLANATTNFTISLLYRNSELKRINTSNTSNVGFVVSSDSWDLQIMSNRLNVTLKDVNLSIGNITANVSLDDTPESAVTVTDIFTNARTLVELFAINTTVNFTSALLTSNYSDSNINDSFVNIYTCHQWNISSRSCSGSWTNITSNNTINTGNNTFTINTTIFSSFALVEGMYCGDGACNAGETSSTCSADCPASSSSSSGGGGGGGGGGGSTIASEKKSIIFTSISVSIAGVITGFDKNLSLTKLSVYVNKAQSNVQVTVDKLKTLPSSVSSPPTGKVFKYLTITKDIANSDLEKVEFEFSVDKNWLSNNNIDEDSIAMYRYTTQWTKLTTEKISSDSTSVKYKATSPGLSYFAIAGEEKQETEGPVQNETEQTETEISEQTSQNETTGETTGTSPAGQLTEAPGDSEPVTAETIAVLIGLVILLVIGFFVYYTWGRPKVKY